MLNFPWRKRKPEAEVTAADGSPEMVLVRKDQLDLLLSQNAEMAALLNKMTSINQAFEQKLKEYHRVYRQAELFMSLLVARNGEKGVITVIEEYRHLALKIQETSRSLIKALEMEPLFFPPEETIH